MLHLIFVSNKVPQQRSHLTLNISSIYEYYLAKDNVKITLISMILFALLCGSILSSTLVGTSYAYQRDPSLPKRPPEIDPNTLVNQGVQCHTATGLGCVNTTVPNAVPRTGMAMAQQSNNVLTGLTIGKDGAMYVTFKAGGAPWKTVGISPKGIFPPGANIAIAKQTNDILAALAVGNDGAMYVSWTAAGGWNKPAGATGPGPYPPVPITPKGMFHPGADIAMVKQTNDRLTGWAVGKNGWLYQAWVDGTGEWNKPVNPPKPGEPVPTYPFKPLFVCCSWHYGRERGPFIGFDREDGGIAAHKLPGGNLAVLLVDTVGQLNAVNILGLCNENQCGTRPSGQRSVVATDIGPWKLFPFGGDVAMAQQAENLVSSLAIGSNGAMYVSWTVGGRDWQGPVQISPPDMFPRGASIAMAKQTSDQLTALSVGKNGALYVSWTAPKGWQGPVGISPPNMFPPGAGIAMV